MLLIRRASANLHLEMQVASNDVHCDLCNCNAGLSNFHLVNGCKNGDYIHRKHNVIMNAISKLCKAASFIVETESSFCFNDRTNKRMSLVMKIDKDILIDATTIDANNPSSGFIRGSDFSSS